MMSRRKATEKPSRESFTLNSDNERDKVVKLFLSTQNNKAETIKNILYDYINNDDVKNSAIINTKNDVIINNGIKNEVKFNTKINEEKKDNTKNSANNYTIDIENEEDEEVVIEDNKDDNAIKNALAGLGIWE